MINYGGLIGSNMVRGAFSSTRYIESSTGMHQASDELAVGDQAEPQNIQSPQEKQVLTTNAPSHACNHCAASPKHSGTSHSAGAEAHRKPPGSFSTGQDTKQTSKAAEESADSEVEEQIRRMKVDIENDESVLDWEHVAGLNSCKTTLDEFASFFLHFPHLTRSLRNRSTTGILLFGPQGTGKTLLVKSFAKRYNLSLYDIRASAIMSKFVGESEKFIRALFRVVRGDTPAVLMLDECDGLLCNPNADSSQSHSYRLLQNEIKNQWSDLMYSRDEVIVIGATNKPHDIDMDGFGRRLSLKLLVDLPSAKSCQQILQIGLDRLRHTLTTSELEELGRMCHEENFSGFDIDTLIEGQLRRAIRGIVVARQFQVIDWEGKGIYVPCAAGDEGAVEGSYSNVSADPEAVFYRPLGYADLRQAVQRARSTVDEGMIQKHVEFASRYGTETE
ncbi:hypothetical protein ANO11243_042600 [Dothideomycetidae sp. 11243]|nr:hypothetical protein ANO11243_042600 [fungal sp. No.11243]